MMSGMSDVDNRSSVEAAAVVATSSPFELVFLSHDVSRRRLTFAILLLFFAFSLIADANIPNVAFAT
jgi:hypothetical protein